MNVVELLQQQAAGVPDRNALIDLTGRSVRTLTYAQFERAAAVAGGVFRRSGLAAGSSVMVIHPVNADLYVALAGMLRAGLIPVVCDPGAGHQQFNRACSTVSPKAVFASAAGCLFAATIPALRGVRYRFSTAGFLGSIKISRGPADPTIVARADDDPALITFTSGSTGLPKALMRTHSVLRAQLDAIRATLPLEGVEIITMPVVLLANLASGATSVIPSIDLRKPGAASADGLAQDILLTQATGIVAPPAMLDGLLRAEPSKLRSLRRIVTGGGPVMPSMVGALQAILPAAEVHSIYGSSEAEPIACLAWSSVSDVDVEAMRCGAGLLAGTATPGSTVRVHDGEIIVAGSHVVPGYLDASFDAETKLRLDEKIWHRTGDGGYVDPSGRLWLTGRIGAVIRDRHGIMESFRVECALSFNGALRRSALIGTSSRRTLLVEPRRGAVVDEMSIRRAIPWAHVDNVQRVGRLPVDRRHNSKIDYPAVRRMLKR